MAVLQTAVLAVLVLLCCGTSQGYRHRLFARNSFQSSSALRSSDSDASFIADKIAASCFHHVEFYTGDATSTYKRFLHSLGLELVAKSDFSTGNSVCASYMLQSGQIRMLFTAPYDAGSGYTWSAEEGGAVPMPGYRPHDASEFFVKHGLGVRAVAIEVEDVAAAYSTMLANNAVGVLPPCRVNSQGENGEQGNLGYADFAEVKLYGDVVLRLVNLDHFQGSFLPRFQDLIHVQGQGQELGQKGPVGAGSSSSISGPPSVGRYGIERFDHIVGNVWKMQDTLAYMQGMTGFHEFAEFTAEDVGSVDSGLNSAVLANSNELILLPVNEPTYGTKRKSQIQTYLEQNKGEGVQHMALFSSDIFVTLRQMRAATPWGGFDFMPGQPAEYYLRRRQSVGDLLTEAQYVLAEEMGILIDQDENGVLLQIFTKPIGDRPTLFFEIIQRVGCKNAAGVQKPGCGGFGKGNFKDLFKKIEDYEDTLAGLRTPSPTPMTSSS